MVGAARSRPASTAIAAIILSPDGRFVAAGVGSLIRVWHIDSGREVVQISGHREDSLTLAFSPDGRLLASGSGGSRSGKVYSVRGLGTGLGSRGPPIQRASGGNYRSRVLPRRPPDRLGLLRRDGDGLGPGETKRGTLKTHRVLERLATGLDGAPQRPATPGPRCGDWSKNPARAVGRDPGVGFVPGSPELTVRRVLDWWDRMILADDSPTLLSEHPAINGFVSVVCSGCCTSSSNSTLV